MRFQCPFCRGVVAVENLQMGEEVQCGHCDEIVTVPRSRFATGAVVGDFIIMEEIGRGGMGVVYLAHQISLDRPAALKILQENYANNAEFVVNFIKEARCAAKLNHPHIVQAYAVGEDEGVFYFAMEYIDGETMKSVLKRDRVIPVDRAVTIIQQIAEALDCAWKEQKLIHRDIKPDNIMLTKNGRAKLADLGLSRIAGDTDEDEGDEIMGTPQYISPEHLTGAPMDVRSDIYSLGATFYQLVTGRFPYEGRTSNEIARKHLEGTLVPPQMVNPKVPEAVSQIIIKMMKKNVNDRYQDAEELVDDLRMFRRGKLPSTLALPKVFSTRTRSVSRSSVASGEDEPGEAEETQQAFQLELPTTTTGSMKPLYTATTTTTSSGLLFAGALDDEIQGPKKKVMLWTILTIIIVVIVGAAIIWFYLIPMMEAPDVAGVSASANSVGGKMEERLYIKNIDEILLAFSQNLGDEQAFLDKADEFFLKYPNPLTEEERLKLKSLLEIYVNLDEKLTVDSARAKLRTEHMAEIAQTKEEAQRAVAEKQRLEAERQRQLREARQREQEERDRKQMIAKRAADYKKSLVKRKNELIYKFVEYGRAGDVKAGEKMFFDAVNEPDTLGSVTYDEKRDARLFATFAKALQQAFEKGSKINFLLKESEDKLAGLQVEIKRGELGKITYVKNGIINIKSAFGDKTVGITVDELKGFYQNTFFERLEKREKLDNSYFYYMLFNGEFQYNLAKIAPDEFWKKELPVFEEVYFKKKLQDVSESERRALKEKFGELDSFKKAE